MIDFSTWLQQIPRSQVLEELRRLEAERAKLDAAIEVRRLALTLAREVPPPGGQPEPEPAKTPEAAESGGTMPPSEAIIHVMSEEPSRTWSFGELMDALVEKGWARDTLSEQKRIRVAAMRLANRGSLARPEPGRYQLVPQFTLGPTFSFNLPPLRKSGGAP